MHHTDHWADGGTTTVDKGKLFCRPCHTQEHAKQRLRSRIRSRT
ncbi:MAG TPA: HNH endonuclease [Acidimicrobiia bacterium]